MRFVLCVAEKNSIARGVAGILSGGSFETQNTSDKYTKNYVFNARFRWLNNGEEEVKVVVTAVRGHLTELVVPQEFGWGQVDPYRLFECPLDFQITDSMADIAINLSNLGSRADFLMIWTDCDREGEFIGAEIAGATKKFTTGSQNLLRAQFSHLEGSHIWHAANFPGKINTYQVQAVKTRIEIDLRAGYAFTRLLTKGVNRGTTVSFGNCQFPTLGFVVDRFNRIKEFRPQATFSLQLSVKQKQKLKLNWHRGRLLDRLTIVAIYQHCLNSGFESVVSSLVDSPTSNWAPLPLTTVELQKDCSRFFKFSAKETLAIAETLYQRGMVSYPRTETDSFPASMDLNKLVQIQTDSPVWGDYAQGLLSNNKLRHPRSGKNNDEAHPPIHPVGSAAAANLNSKEAKVYEFIVRRFLACCSHDAKGHKRTLTLKWGSEYFSVKGLTVTERNYLDIYPYSKWESNNVEIPQVAIGDILPLHEAKISQGETSPPKGLTETELIALMDLNGIGTDATIAEHIEKIITRGYIVKLKRKSIPWGDNATLDLSAETGRGAQEYLLPTKLGYGLTMGFSNIGLDNISLTKPFLRREMEYNLKLISQGGLESNKVIKDTINVYKEIYDITQGQLGIIKRFI